MRHQSMQILTKVSLEFSDLLSCCIVHSALKMEKYYNKELLDKCERANQKGPIKLHSIVTNAHSSFLIQKTHVVCPRDYGLYRLQWPFF